MCNCIIRNDIEDSADGRIHDIADDRITVVTPVRCYTMNSRAEAPVDSNHYFN